MKADTRKDPAEYNDQSIEFFDTPGMDRLYSMCMILAEELAVANEMIDTLQQLLVSKELVSQKDIESFKPDATALLRRSQSHQELVQRLLSSIDTEIDNLESQKKG